MSEVNRDVDEMAKDSPSPPISDDEHEEPPAFSLATLGLQRVGTVPPPKPQPAQPIQLLNARGMPARIRKRNRFFFDDNIINDDKPLRMSLSPRKTPMKNSLSPGKTPTKVLKKRKGVISRYMRTEEMKRSAASGAGGSAAAGASGAGGAGGGAGAGGASGGGAAAADGADVSTPPRSASGTHSGHTTPKTASEVPQTPTSCSAQSLQVPADKMIAQQIGLRLRNLLKLPKAHKWVIYEWFYSFMDKPLFEGENDFQICLAESFPNLRTRQLTRAEWRQIRSLLGKPRRCSPAFFEEERRELERKRQKIRYLQTRKSGDVKDLNFMRELPDKIPLPLPVGTKVTARLRTPQDGIFSGTVDAFDSQTSSYRVTFDRAGLGTHSVPDIEIVSENFHEMLSLQSITKDFRPNLMSVFNNAPDRSLMGGLHGVRSALKMNLNKSDPLLGREVIDSPYRNPVLQRENLNGYPMKLLETMVRLKRALAIKRSKLQRLSEMNNEAELRASQQATSAAHNSSSDESQPNGGDAAPPLLSEEFQRRYASIVISLEKMNRDMQEYLNELQTFSTDLTRDPLMQAMMTPSYLREKCREAAEDAVERKNQTGIQNKNMLQLIKSLTTVLMVASHLKNDGNSAHVSKVLEGCIEEVKSSLHGENVETFQKHVQIHLHHIRTIFGQASATATATATGTAASEAMACGSSGSPMSAAADK